MGNRVLETILQIGLGVINPLYGVAAATALGAKNDGLEGALMGGLSSFAGGKLGDFLGEGLASIGGEALSQTPDALTTALKEGGRAVGDGASTGAAGSGALIDELTGSIRSGIPTINTLDVGKGVAGTIGADLGQTVKRGGDMLGQEIGQNIVDTGLGAIAQSQNSAPDPGPLAITESSMAAPSAPTGGSGLPITNSTAPKIYPWVTDERLGR